MNGNRSYLGRLLDVLEFVADQPDAATLTDVVAGTGVPTSTASRLLGLLTERGYLQRGADGTHTLGPRLAHLGLRTVAHLRGTQRLEEATRELLASTGESASAGLLLGAELVLVARHEPTHPLRVVARVGDIIAPHTSAMGKAVLANLPASRQLEVLAAAVGEDKAASLRADLADELAAVRDDGYAIDEQTYAVGQRCRATALLDHHGHAIGGVSIAGPAARFTLEAAEAALPELTEVASRLSAVGLGEPATVTVPN